MSLIYKRFMAIIILLQTYGKLNFLPHILPGTYFSPIFALAIYLYQYLDIYRGQDAQNKVIEKFLMNKNLYI